MPPLLDLYTYFAIGSLLALGLLVYGLVGRGSATGWLRVVGITVAVALITANAMLLFVLF